MHANSNIVATLPAKFQSNSSSVIRLNIPHHLIMRSPNEGKG